MAKAANKNFLKKFWKPILVFFVFAAVIISWGSISWLFNSAYVWRYLTGLMSPTGGRKPATVMTSKPATKPVVLPVSTTPANVVAQPPATPIATAPIRNVPDTITVPSINISAPIVTTLSTDVDAIHALLDTGVVLYPGSAAFGQMGETIILGHSAPPGWPKIKYDWVFSKVENLKPGDKIKITYSNKTYSYTVAKIKVLDKGQEVPSNIATANTLALVSCWPPGKDIQRIAVLAVIDN